MLISDARQPARLTVQTPSVAGTQDWTLVESVFSIAPDTRELKIQIYRPAIETPLAGESDAWITDVSVEPE